MNEVFDGKFCGGFPSINGNKWWINLLSVNIAMDNGPFRLISYL